MKRIMIIVIAALVIWNVLLTSMIIEQRDLTPKIEKVTNNITVNGFSTDLTEIIEASKSKMVRVRDDITSHSGIIYEVYEDEVIVVTSLSNTKLDQVIKVVFDNQEEVEARMIGYDEASNILVLSVSPDFEVAPYNQGDTKATKQGEYAIALSASSNMKSEANVSIGFITNTLTYSESSATAKANINLNDINSGVAIINMVGDLIGVGLQTSPSNGNSNILPINELKLIVDKVYNKEAISKAVIGIDVIDISYLTNYQKSKLNIELSRQSGLYIQAVDEDSIAATSELQVGMIITEVNGQVIESIFDYHDVTYSIQDTLVLKGYINQDNFEINVILND